MKGYGWCPSPIFDTLKRSIFSGNNCIHLYLIFLSFTPPFLGEWATLGKISAYSTWESAQINISSTYTHTKTAGPLAFANLSPESRGCVSLSGGDSKQVIPSFSCFKQTRASSHQKLSPASKMTGRPPATLFTKGFPVTATKPDRDALFKLGVFGVIP